MNRHFEGYVYHLFYFVKADMHLHEGPDQIHSGYYYESKLERKEEEKSPTPGRIQTHNLMSFCSRGICSTAVLQLRPLKFVLDFFKNLSS